LAAVLICSPVYAGVTLAPQPFETAEDLFYGTYVDLQSSIMRLGEFYHVEHGPEIHEIWSYHYEFDITNRPKEWMPRILKVYVQTYTVNGKPSFRIMLEETKYRLGGIEEIHHVYMEDRNLDTWPDVIEENWVVIDTSKGHRTIKDMRSKGDPTKGYEKIDRRWDRWFAYWMKVQIFEFKETFKLRPFQDNPKMEI